MRGPAFASPRRGTLSFVTQKFFCFGAINNRRNIGWTFLFAVTSDGYLPEFAKRSLVALQAPYIKHSMVPCVCYKYDK